MNAFGEKQHIEKFIPKVIKSLLNDELIYIHSYPDKKQSGTRFYIHARNIAEGVLFILKNGNIGESYNITGEKEVSNLEIAETIAKIMNKELKYELVDFHTSRPGHDLRYGLDGSKLKDLGWELPLDFEKSLEKTVLWTENYQYRRIDGSVETERRMQLVKEFNEDMNIFIFLISTKFEKK